MTNSEILKRALFSLASIQIQIDKNGGPGENGDLVEEYLLLRSNILTSLGLHETNEVLKILIFDCLPTEMVLLHKIKQLYQVAEHYLLSPPKPPIDVLKAARKSKDSPFKVLPEIGISTHIFTIFIYKHLFLGKSEPVEKIWQSLQISNHPKVLSALGNLDRVSSDEAKIGQQLLKDAGIMYLDEYLLFLSDKIEKTKGSQLDEFWSDIL